MSAPVCPRCQGPMSRSDRAAYCPRCAGRLLLDTDRTGDAVGEPPGAGNVFRLGEYELGAELGRGAMGVVYRARQPGLKRDVAVKMILASRFAGEAARKRFLAEAELIAQLDHPNIVPIYEVGETADGPFYAMKLIEGWTLAAKVEGGRLKLEGSSNQQLSTFNLQPCDTAALLAKISRAVHHAHQRGVLHRDLKPGNILLDAQGEPHITDFGLARKLGVESSLTVSGSSFGTPAYMSPEQARGEKTLTTASDVWSLGAILYHLLAGRPPFEGESALEVMRKVMDSEPGRMTNADLRFASSDEGRRVNRKSEIVNPDLETICLKCLEKDPARRYTSARALAEDLERWLNHEPILARPRTAVERITKWAQRRPAIAALTALAGVLVIVAITGITWQWRRAERNAAAERASNEKAQEQLWHSRLGQARAGRLSGQFGRKRAGLEAIAAAAAIRPAAELRDEAIAHLALFDLQSDPRPRPLTNGLSLPTFDDEVTKYAVADEAAGVILVRRVSDDGELSRWPAPRGVVDLGLSPQGRYFFFSSEGQFFLFDTYTGQERLRLRDCVRATVSPDDQTLVVIDRNLRVRFHDTATGQAHPQELTIRKADNNYLYWSPDSRFLILIDNDRLEIWDWRRHERVERLPNEWTLSGAVAWRGECLAFGDNLGGIQVWNSRTRKLRRLSGHDDAIYHLLLPADGTMLISVSPDGTTRFWNTATGQLVLTTDRGFAWEFSRDGRRVAYRTPSSWGVWQTEPSREYRLISTREQISSPVSTADFSPDGRALLTSALWSGVHWVDLNSGRVVKLDSGRPRAGWFLPDGQTILTSGDNQPALFRPLTLITNAAGELLPRLGPGHAAADVEWRNSDVVSLSDDGRWLGTRLNSREVVVFDLTGTNPVLRLRGPARASRPTFGAEGRWIVTSCPEHGPVLWDGHTGELVRVLHSHPGYGRAQFSPDGRRLVTSDPTGVRFYDTANWAVLRHWPTHPGSDLVGAMGFTPDSRMVAVTTGKRELRLADARTGERLATLISPEPRAINTLRFSRDGRQLAVATTTDAVDLWDIARIEDELKKLGLALQP